MFADDTSLFSIVNDPNTSANELNKDLQKISEWAYQWKMSLNPDQNKQAQEVIFSREITKFKTFKTLSDLSSLMQLL